MSKQVRYMVVIATGASRRFGPRVGWDTEWETRAQAIACADRARRNDGWSVKVVAVKP